MTTKPDAGQPASSAPPPPATTRRRLSGLLNRLGRLALIVCIAGAGWYTWTVYSDLLHGPRPAPPPETAPAAPATIPRFDLMGTLPGDGPWLFAGQPWEI